MVDGESARIKVLYQNSVPFFLIIQTEPISIGLDVMQVNLFAYEIMQEKNNNNN